MPSPDADPVVRLTAIGLPPRAAGWVPAQPASVPTPAVEGYEEKAELPPASRLDDVRLALADRLPTFVASRVEQATNGTILTWLAVVVALVVVIAMKLHGHQAASYDDNSGPSYDDSPAASAPSDPTAEGSSIVVDVGGRVRHPGLVTLPIGARVADAIRAAGGPLRHRELARIDLAARVADGQLLMVGVPAAADPTTGGSPAPVSLSTASLDQLETLPGVGPVTAQKIIDWRTTHGGFTSVAQLQQVSGIGPARYSQLSPLVTP
ncbi:MAG TPA: ComEA family DNA-binding protein [Mycobacteriales bacterium]|nr:ComEA family DNA-binding protein [Mycobacteriales bacterium]